MKGIRSYVRLNIFVYKEKVKLLIEWEGVIYKVTKKDV